MRRHGARPAGCVSAALALPIARSLSACSKSAGAETVTFLLSVLATLDLTQLPALSEAAVVVVESEEGAHWGLCCGSVRVS